MNEMKIIIFINFYKFLFSENNDSFVEIILKILN